MVFFKYSYYFILISFIVLWCAAQVGVLCRSRHPLVNEHEDKDLTLLLSATLTLLALIIGFSFSMAIERYDLRKIDESVEANSIATEYLRTSLMSPSDGDKTRNLLQQYLDLRVQYYRLSDSDALHRLKAQTQTLQGTMWAAVTPPAMVNANAITALPVTGMNDVINAEGYAQAVSWNRIPIEAWVLLFSIAIAANILFGYTVHGVGLRSLRVCILPIVISIALSLIADIESPRGGMIRVTPQNLEKLASTFQAYNINQVTHP